MTNLRFVLANGQSSLDTISMNFQQQPDTPKEAFHDREVWWRPGRCYSVWQLRTLKEVREKKRLEDDAQFISLRRERLLDV